MPGSDGRLPRGRATPVAAPPHPRAIPGCGVPSHRARCRRKPWSGIAARSWRRSCVTDAVKALTRVLMTGGKHADATHDPRPGSPFRPSGSDRLYFQAFKGRNYSLVVRNNTGRRVGVLIAVDGLNVVTGERSSLSRNESMYVLDPNERAVIRGWRTSLDQVRRFVFVDEEHSYAERTDQANGDLGWIR